MKRKTEMTRWDLKKRGSQLWSRLAQLGPGGAPDWLEAERIADYLLLNLIGKNMFEWSEIEDRFEQRTRRGKLKSIGNSRHTKMDAMHRHNDTIVQWWHFRFMPDFGSTLLGAWCKLRTELFNEMILRMRMDDDAGVSKENRQMIFQVVLSLFLHTM